VGTGEQKLNLWLLEPGVVLQKILLDFGGLEESALGPPESRYIHARTKIGVDTAIPLH
jgi:hypothetical protein